MDEDQPLNVQLLNRSSQSSSTGADSSASANTSGDQKSLPVTGKIFLLVLIALIITLSVTTLTSIDSYLKEFHAPIIELDSVTVHPFNISSHRITANWTIKFSIANPDYGASYYYRDMEASISLKNETICSKVIGDLILDGASMNKTVEIENVAGDWVYLNKTREGAEWRRDRVVTVSFKINGSGRKGPEVDNENKRRRNKMVAYCDDLKVGFIDNDGVANLFTPPIMCYVRLFDNYFL